MMADANKDSELELAKHTLQCSENDACTVLNALVRETLKAPDHQFPSLCYLDANKHAICYLEDIYSSLAIIVSKGAYTDRAFSPKLKDWLWNRRGNKSKTFDPYFCTVLYALRLPKQGIIDLLNSSNYCCIVMTKEALAWIENRVGNSSPFTRVEFPDSCTAVLRLGHPRVVPWRIVSTTEDPTLPTFEHTPCTPFVTEFINRALRGGKWLSTKFAKSLASGDFAYCPKEFHKTLDKCLFENMNCAGFCLTLVELSRHAWDDSKCISLCQVNDQQEMEFVNYAFVTCLLYMQQMNMRLFHESRLSHVTWILENNAVNTRLAYKPCE